MLGLLVIPIDFGLLFYFFYGKRSSLFLYERGLMKAQASWG